MQAIILAAGMGRRLGELTDDNTKCMVEVNGIRLIDRTLECLKAVGIERLIIVVGYKAKNLIQYVGNNYKGMSITYVENTIFDRTNNIYSLYLAKDYLLSDDTLLLESDLIYEVSVLRRLIEDKYPNLAIVDKYESWMDGTVVTLDDENRINNFISKSHFKYSDKDYYYKTVNVYKFSKEFSATHYVPFLEAYCQALGNNEYYEQVLRVITLLEDSPLRALPLKGEKWYEIDDIQDLDIASSMFEVCDEKRFLSISSRYGGYWRYPSLLDFYNLTNPYFPPQQMVDEIKSSFETLMREYPSSIEVNGLLASKMFSVRCDYVVVGNGVSELIKFLVENNYANEIGVVCQSMEECQNIISKYIIASYIPNNIDFKYDANGIINFFSDKEIKTLMLINPDNLAGNYISYRDLINIMQWTKSKGIKLIIDESYLDFVEEDGSSLLNNKILSANDHLFIVKDFSKSYGVPGCRLGILASGNVEVVAKLKESIPRWNLNSFAEFYMQIHEKYNKDYIKACNLLKSERIRFYSELQSIQFLRVIPSQTNYFYCEIKRGVMTSTQLAYRLLSDYNILIKDCSKESPFIGGNYVRIAIRNGLDNVSLVMALRKYLN